MSLSVLHSPFDDCRSPFSPFSAHRFFEIDAYTKWHLVNDDGASITCTCSMMHSLKHLSPLQLCLVIQRRLEGTTSNVDYIKSSCFFSGASRYTESSKSFLYSLYNTKGYQPIQLNLTRPNHQKYAIYSTKGYGPRFGNGYNDLRISNLAINNANSYTIVSSYEPPPGCNIGSHCSYFAGQNSFTPNDVEVFYYNNETRKLKYAVPPPPPR